MWLLLSCASSPEPEPTTPDPVSLCDDGAPKRTFDAGGDEAGLYALAGDTSVPLRDGGSFVLSEVFDGCGTTLVVPSRPVQEDGNPFALWERDLDELLEKLPEDTHVVFVSNADAAGDVEDELVLIESGLAAALEDLPPKRRDHWTSRLHVASGPASALEGWFGEAARSPGFGFGVDRFQRQRWIGSYADGRRYDAGMGWFQSNVSFVAHEAIAWNFEAKRQARLDAEGATVVPVFTGEVLSDPDWAGVRAEAVVTMPAVLTDRLELDLRLDCVGDGEVGECPAWDYLVHAWLCEGTDPTDCPTELGRWITTYHREGRWTVDASHVLPLLQPGEQRAIVFYTQQPYETHLDLRFWDDPEEDTAPAAAIPLFSGGTLSPAYNDAHPPMTVEVPAGTTQAELVMLVTGHGGEAPWNCAEFCVTEHRFTVNGVEHAVSLEGAGSSQGCQDEVDRGTIPNQYGTWFYGRSNWCPGREVRPIRVDVTADVVPGQEAEIAYAALFNGADYPGSVANIVLSSWLVTH